MSRFVYIIAFLFILVSHSIVAQNLVSGEEDPWTSSRFRMMAGRIYSLPELNGGIHNNVQRQTLAQGFQLTGMYNILSRKLPFNLHAYGAISTLTNNIKIDAPASSLYEGSTAQLLTLNGPRFSTGWLGLECNYETAVKRDRKFSFGGLYIVPIVLQRQNGKNTLYHDLPNESRRLVMDYVYKSDPFGRQKEANGGFQVSVIQRVTKKVAVSLTGSWLIAGPRYNTGIATFYPQNGDPVFLSGAVVKTRYFGISLGIVWIEMHELKP